MTDADRAFEALGDATRRAIFFRLRSGALSVGELAAGLEVTRPAVSQHLAVLRSAGLAVSHAEGTRRIYEVDRRGLRAIREWLDEFWGRALAAYKIAAEREAAKTKKGRPQ